MTLALHHMCSSLWPGIASEGILYFKDLTAPAVFLQTLSTPLGTLGAIVPLCLVLLYTVSSELSAGGGLNERFLND